MPRPRKVDNAAILDAIVRLTDDGTQFNSTDLGDAVGLSRPTVNRRLKEMDEQNLLRVKPFRDDNGHRRYAVKVLARGRKVAERYRRDSAA